MAALNGSSSVHSVMVWSTRTFGNRAIIGIAIGVRTAMVSARDSRRVTSPPVK